VSARPPIPARLNLALVGAAVPLACGLLWLASATSSWPLRIAAALGFSLIGNTLFALLHEAVHGILHPDARVNAWLGRLTAAFFPTGFTFQRICHLGHHRRNRSDAELFDYYRPGDSKALKFLQWYGILTGVYWLSAPLGCLAYLCLAPLLGERLLRIGELRVLRQSGGTAMLSGFEGAPRATICAEILLSAAVQVALFQTLHLNATGYALCYAAFALNWSSLQYADHAWSALDAKRGAWNLRVNPLLRAFFLNYHDHRVHHEDPGLSWIHLPRFVDPAEERPSFGAIYLSMWRGPRPYPSDTRA
jgi:fatty acid desaturase